jgi:diguanylate cyclase (GGDEF)-like protein
MNQVVGWLRTLALSLLLLTLLGPARGQAVPGGSGLPLVPLTAAASTDLLAVGRLVQAEPGEAFPSEGEDLAAWASGHRPATQVQLTGGHYWLLARIRHDAPGTDWVFDPHNSLIEHVQLRLAGPQGTQSRTAGYAAEREFPLHYGQRVTLQPGTEYTVVVRFDSRYFASVPRFSFVPEAAYRKQVLRDNLLVIGSLGAMVVLALFNLFLFSLTRTASHAYYALQLGLAVWAWSMVFQWPTEAFGWQGLHWHYVPFFLLPAAASLFCIDFLQLRERHPRLFKLHLGVIVFGLALTPLSLVALPWAHLVASALISVWLLLTVATGVVSLRGGYRPARFYVLAFSTLLVPGLVILPGNMDLIPDLVDNAELFTLLGSAAEALLQAFALADRIRLLGQEKDRVARQLIHTLEVAHTDAMTGLGNRYAFDLMVDCRAAGLLKPDEQPCVLCVIDLDGLKLINDQHGHARGDDLIRTVGLGLQALQSEGARCYRLGGDEFAILAPRHQEQRIADQLTELERVLVATGFERSGVSMGVAHWEPGCDPHELVKRADRHMYQNKARRKAERGQPPRDGTAPLTSLIRPE